MMLCVLVFAAALLGGDALVLHRPPQAIQSARAARRDVRLSAAAGAAGAEDVAVVLLAGGVGSRMKADRPKQFLELCGKPVLEHSLDLFLGLEGINSVVLVIDASYRDRFAEYAAGGKLSFADPGAERQDSVRSGLDGILDGSALVCIHDAARPLVTPKEIFDVIGDARAHGAAVLGVPVKATVSAGVLFYLGPPRARAQVKESDDGEFVLRTVDRSRLWEVHTPQVIKPDLLLEGFDRVREQGLEVTDDVSIVEQLGLPVKLTRGEYTNLKVTTPDDMVVATQILDERAAAAA